MRFCMRVHMSVDGQAVAVLFQEHLAAIALEDACVASAKEALLAPPSSGVIDQQRSLHRRMRA